MARYAYPALLTLGVLAIYWKFTLTNQFSWFDGYDHVNQVIPWLEMQAREWHQGRFPILDPYQWAGTALLGQNQPGTLHPLNWLLFSLPLKYGRLQVPILNGYFVLMHMIGAWCMYALARSLRISRASSTVGALGYGCGGFLAAVHWPQMLNGAGYLPLVALFWLRYLRRPGRYIEAATAGAITGFLSLAGHHSAPELTLVLVTVVTAHRLLTRWSAARAKRIAAGLAVYGVFFVLLGAALTLPAVEFWRESLRWVGAKQPVTWTDTVPYAAHRLYSLGASSLPGFVIAGFHAEGPLNPFLGVTFAALAVQGYLSRRGPLANCLLFVAVAGVVLAMGESSWAHGLFYAAFPLFDKMRMPSMLAILTHVAAVLLAGIGLDSFRQTRRPLVYLLWTCAAVATLAVCTTHVTAKEHVKQMEPLALFAFFSGAMGFALLYRNAAAAAALVLLELGSTTGADFSERELGWEQVAKLRQLDDVAEFLRKKAETDPPFRVSAENTVEPTHFSTMYGIEDAGGSCCGVLKVTLTDHWMDGVQRLLGARFHIGMQPKPGYGKLVFTSKSDFKVWETEAYAPRVFTVHQAKTVPVEAMAFEYERGVRYLQSTLVTAAPVAVEQCAGADRVRLTNLEPRYARVEVEMACAGALVFTHSLFPGWEATHSIFPAYNKVMAVRLDKGKHTVEFRYPATRFRQGAALSLAGLAALLAWWAVQLRQNRAASAGPSRTPA